jgi:hypothetical protein
MFLCTVFCKNRSCIYVLRLLSSQYHTMHLQDVHSAKIVRRRYIYSKDLFTVKSCFHTTGMHVQGVWLVENPPEIWTSPQQLRFSINMWTGILVTALGFLQLVAAITLIFVEHTYMDRWKLYFNTRLRMLYQYNCAPPHYILECVD